MVIIGTCPRCHEAVEIQVSKRALKAMLKGFKQSTPSMAEMVAEKIIGRDKNGDLRE
jgi:hypothetical protein